MFICFFSVNEELSREQEAKLKALIRYLALVIYLYILSKSVVPLYAKNRLFLSLLTCLMCKAFISNRHLQQCFSSAKTTDLSSNMTLSN